MVPEVIETTGRGRPRRVAVEHGRPVKLVITRLSDETCATDIVLGAYGIKEVLPLGKPVEISFTPTRAEEITYACSMNMVTGIISVH